jgi:hypothetical protein
MACTTIRTRDTLNRVAGEPSPADAVAQVALDALSRLLGIPQGGFIWRDFTQKPAENPQDSIPSPPTPATKSDSPHCTARYERER